GGELSLRQLSTPSGLPQPTIHRELRTLLRRGYVRQLPSRQYALRSRIMRLGVIATSVIRAWTRPHRAGLADATGETANMAMLDGDLAVYVAQVPSRHSMRMFTEVGRRVHPHCTGVGKAMLAQLPEDSVRGILARTGMPAETGR